MVEPEISDDTTVQGEAMTQVSTCKPYIAKVIPAHKGEPWIEGV